MEHTNTNSIFNEKGKKAVALFAAGTLVVTGAVATVSKLFKRNDVPSIPETSISDMIPEDDMLLLSGYLDTNNLEEVIKRAEAMSLLSEGAFSAIDIQNLINILAENGFDIVFPEDVKTEEEKSFYIQDLVVEIANMLDVIDEDAKGEQLYAYMFAGDKVSGSIAKDLAKKIAKNHIIYKENVIIEDEIAIKKTADEFYGYYEEFIKYISEDKLTSGEIVLIGKQISALIHEYSMYLTDKQVENLENILNKIQNAAQDVFGKASSKYSMADRKIDKTPLTEAYNSSDAKVANTHSAAKDDSINVTKKVSEGGIPVKNSSGKKETQNVPTTKKETTTFKVPVTDGKVTVTNPSSGETFVVEVTGEGSYEYTIPGGKPVGDVEYYDANDAELAEKYVDADNEELAKKYSTTYTLG